MTTVLDRAPWEDIGPSIIARKTRTSNISNTKICDIHLHLRRWPTPPSKRPNASAIEGPSSCRHGRSASSPSSRSSPRARSAIASPRPRRPRSSPAPRATSSRALENAQHRWDWSRVRKDGSGYVDVLRDGSRVELTLDPRAAEARRASCCARIRRRTRRRWCSRSRTAACWRWPAARPREPRQERRRAGAEAVGAGGVDLQAGDRDRARRARRLARHARLLPRRRALGRGVEPALHIRGSIARCNSLAFGAGQVAERDRRAARARSPRREVARAPRRARSASATTLPFELPVEPSAAHVPDGGLAFARTAAGFWNTTLSPLHGAYLAATLARGGVTPPLAPRSIASSIATATPCASDGGARASRGRRSGGARGRPHDGAAPPSSARRGSASATSAPIVRSCPASPSPARPARSIAAIRARRICRTRGSSASRPPSGPRSRSRCCSATAPTGTSRRTRSRAKCSARTSKARTRATRAWRRANPTCARLGAHAAPGRHRRAGPARALRRHQPGAALRRARAQLRRQGQSVLAPLVRGAAHRSSATFAEERELLSYGLGITNVCARPSKSAAELSRAGAGRGRQAARAARATVEAARRRARRAHHLSAAVRARSDAGRRAPSRSASAARRSSSCPIRAGSTPAFPGSSRSSSGSKRCASGWTK